MNRQFGRVPEVQLQHLARNRVVCRAKFLQICGKVMRLGADDSINGVACSSLQAGRAGIRQPAERSNECAEEPNVQRCTLPYVCLVGHEEHRNKF